MSIHNQLQVSFGGEKKGAIEFWSFPMGFGPNVPRNVVVLATQCLTSGHFLILSEIWKDEDFQEHDFRKHETEWVAGAQF